MKGSTRSCGWMVECRLHRAVPQNWSAPLISSYDFAGKAGLSSGVLMLDKRHSDLLSIWKYYAHKYTKQPDDFVLEFLLEEFGWPFQFVPLDFCSRQSTAQVIRGEWSNETTIVSHPSTNRWPYPRRYRRAFNGWWSSVKNINRLRKHILLPKFRRQLQRSGLVHAKTNPPLADFRDGHLTVPTELTLQSSTGRNLKRNIFANREHLNDPSPCFSIIKRAAAIGVGAIRKMKLDASHRLTERRAAKSN